MLWGEHFALLNICWLYFFFSLFNVQAVKKVCLLSLAVCFGLLFSGIALKGRKRLLCTAGMAGSEPQGGQHARDGCPCCVHGANPWGLRDPGARDARPGLSLPCMVALASCGPSPIGRVSVTSSLLFPAQTCMHLPSLCGIWT